jgi:hypothetical protein
MRSLINLAMLSALNRPHEFKVHVKGALTNGCTAEQIQDILLLVAMYCGIPAANEPIALRSMCCARPKRPNRAPAVLRFCNLGSFGQGSVSRPSAERRSRAEREPATVMIVELGCRLSCLA